MEYSLPKPPGDMGSNKDVEVDSCKFHCSSDILVLRKHRTEAMQVNTALDRGSGLSCISSGLGAKLFDHLRGLQVKVPFGGGYSAKVADRHQVRVAKRMGKV